MDEENEKKVWKLLLDTATNYSAQYFYFAPKFPRNLEFNDNMTVIICFNGRVRNGENEKKNGNPWDLDKLIRKTEAKRNAI